MEKQTLTNPQPTRVPLVRGPQGRAFVPGVVIPRTWGPGTEESPPQTKARVPLVRGPQGRVFVPGVVIPRTRGPGNEETPSETEERVPLVPRIWGPGNE